MEEKGWIRRGMFVTGLGAAQFAMPAAVEMLRGVRSNALAADVVMLAASDPANPYGTLLPWPRAEAQSSEAEPAGRHSCARVSGASVILIDGQLVAFLRRANPSLQAFLPETEPERSRFARELSSKLADTAIRRQSRRQGLLIGTINNAHAQEHALAAFLERAGFVNTALGFQMRRVKPIAGAGVLAEDSDQQGEEARPAKGRDSMEVQ
jgi:ATP-dependent Lhr-like helicase